METNQNDTDLDETQEEHFKQARLSINSDIDYDDELGVPEIKLIDMGDGPIPVAIENNDDTYVEEEINVNDGLPLSSLHNYKKFGSFHRDVFIKGVDILATITDYERNLTTHMINPNLYTISLVHGNFSWSIKKRYKQIQALHQQLILFRTSLNIPFPTKTHRNKRDSLREDSATAAGRKKRKKAALPRFPKKPEMLITNEKIGFRMKQLESYLNNLLSIAIYRNHPATIDFLEVSHLSFIKGLGFKGKEGLVKKKTGSTIWGQSGCGYFGLCHCFCCVRCQSVCNDMICSRWVKRWFFVKDTCFGYLNPDDGRIKSVVLYDQGFEVASGMYSIGLQTGFQIQTLSRQLTFKCWTRRKSKEWIQVLKETAATTAKEFTQPNRNRSFAPVRSAVRASWFADGAGYMSAVADAMEDAKEEIFITDWWLSPEIHLKRPAMCGDRWQLNKLLERKAKSGVKIYILLYKEVEMALGLNSYYSKQKLSECSENIKVLRHPDHARAGVFLWAHHEKMVIVDQSCAFLGGIDLCYGRWDDNSHRLTDLGSIKHCSLDLTTAKKRTSSLPSGDSIYPIPTPYYARTPLPLIDESQPPTPPPSSPSPDPNRSPPPASEPGDHLLTLRIPKPGPDGLKINTPEMERKNIVDSLKSKGKELLNLVYGPNEDEEFEGREPASPADDKVLGDGETGKIKPEGSIDDLDGSAKLWIGKDYVNFIVKDFQNLESPFDDFIDRSTTPRMPWHDVGVGVKGAAARDLARHFVQRWNSTKLEKAKKNVSYPYLLPKSSRDGEVDGGDGFGFGGCQVTCQVLRSVSTWSCGFLEPDTVEQSIHEAYIDVIGKAQHYVYIENQFFISLPYDNVNTKNQIAEALYKRIMRAYKAKEVFRVYVVMPLLPGFEGEVGGPSGTSLHAITHWNYASISQGKDAILNRLRASGIADPSEYITFYGLRNHSVLNSEPITELIYVHSKLAIVDDRIVICGSANINDRSLIGKRDSEVAILVEDEHFEDGLMNGQAFPSGQFAGSLRKHLFKEHLGLSGDCRGENLDVDLTDPTIESFYRDVWFKTASLNTEFYEKVFHCIPTDSAESFGDLKRLHDEKPMWVDEFSRAQKMLDSIQGHIVLLPLNFLYKENLLPAASTMEGMMPTSLWT